MRCLIQRSLNSNVKVDKKIIGQISKGLVVLVGFTDTDEIKDIDYMVNKIINLPFGGRSPFTAEGWYINKGYNLDIKWGTPSPIQIQDPKYGIFAPVRSNGAFGIHIADSKKFLIKLVATMPTFVVLMISFSN